MLSFSSIQAQPHSANKNAKVTATQSYSSVKSKKSSIVANRKRINQRAPYSKLPIKRAYGYKMKKTGTYCGDSGITYCWERIRTADGTYIIILEPCGSCIPGRSSGFNQQALLKGMMTSKRVYRKSLSKKSKAATTQAHINWAVARAKSKKNSNTAKKNRKIRRTPFFKYPKIKAFGYSMQKTGTYCGDSGTTYCWKRIRTAEGTYIIILEPCGSCIPGRVSRFNQQALLKGMVSKRSR